MTQAPARRPDARLRGGGGGIVARRAPRGESSNRGRRHAPRPRAARDAASGCSTRRAFGHRLLRARRNGHLRRAGTPLREIEALIAQRGQMLPFEPMDHRALYGGARRADDRRAGRGQHLGPAPHQRRRRARRLIGLRLVNGRGEIIKSGGRVMKNVTGPRSRQTELRRARNARPRDARRRSNCCRSRERAASIVIRRLDDRRAIEAMSLALGSPFGVSGAAHLSAPAWGASFRARSCASRVLRIPSTSASRAAARAARRIRRQARLAGRGIRSASGAPCATRLPRRAARARRSGASASRPRRARRLRRQRRRARALDHFYDWGGGLVWLSEPTHRGGAARYARPSPRSAAMRRWCARPTDCAPASMSSSRCPRR